MTIRTIMLGTALFLAGPTTAAPMTAADFAHKAAATDMFEIESSKLALTKSSNASVKDFANMMIKDHTKSSADLMMAAKAASPKVMIDKSLDPMKKDALAKLNAAPKGAAFDKAYLDAQTKGHTMALMTMKDYAANGSVAPLKTFASNTSKVVETHLEHVKKLDAAMK